jgi:hypothetical protein
VYSKIYGDFQVRLDGAPLWTGSELPLRPETSDRLSRNARQTVSGDGCLARSHCRFPESSARESFPAALVGVLATGLPQFRSVAGADRYEMSYICARPSCGQASRLRVAGVFMVPRGASNRCDTWKQRVPVGSRSRHTSARHVTAATGTAALIPRRLVDPV